MAAPATRATSITSWSSATSCTGIAGTLRQSDGELQEEVIGFNRFEPNEARLYACRIAWSASGASRDLRPLLTLDVYEKADAALRDPRRTRARADAARPGLAVRRGPRCSHSAAAGAGP